MLSRPLLTRKNNAFLAIDKPAGITSFAVIRELRKITGIRKIGHTGTLDPFAEGLLICCIGSFTRLADFCAREDKTYTATMKLGEQRDTGDPEGEIIATASIPEFKDKLDSLAKKALQIEELPVPAYSAVKIEGKRAYELARQKEQFNLPKRAVQITEFEFLPLNPEKPEELSYRCRVSKGTYIRALSEWLAEQLNTVAYTTFLRRESIGRITLQNAVTLQELNMDNWVDYGLDYSNVFPFFPCRNLNGEEFAQVMNGKDIALGDENADNYLLLFNSELWAIGKRSNNLIHPEIVLK